MKIAISFSLLFRDVLDGKVKVDEFDALFFKCKREHLFRTDSSLPREVTDHYLDVDRSTPKVLDAWYKVMEKVRELDLQGRVHFRLHEVLNIHGHQAFAAVLHEQGHEVWLNGDWYKPESEFQKTSAENAVERSKTLAEGRHATEYANFFEQYGAL